MNARSVEFIKTAKKNGVPLTFEKGQVLYYQDHQPFGAFLIEEGRVELTVVSSGGRKEVIGLVSTGEFAGLDDLLSKKEYTASATCIAKCRVLFLSKIQIQDTGRGEVAKKSASL